MEWYHWVGIIWACLAALTIIFDISGLNKLSPAILAPLFFYFFALFFPAMIYIPCDGSRWLRHGKILNCLKIIFAPIGILMALVWWGIYLVLPQQD